MEMWRWYWLYDIWRIYIWRKGRSSSNVFIFFYNNRCNYLDFDQVWPEYYKRDIIDQIPLIDKPDENNQYILGGEAAVWCEGIDYTTVEYRIWPRGLAVIETLWAKHESLESFLPRLVSISDRLRIQGIKVAPFSNSIPEILNFGEDNGYDGYSVQKYVYIFI